MSLKVLIGQFRIVFSILLFALSGASFAACFDTTPLTSYEPNEANGLTVTVDENKDPTLTIEWPVLGGVNNVPVATEGNYVLKLEWTNETNPKKVEVGHYWTNFTFDLASVDFIHVDVYIATESALADVNGVGIWDSQWEHPWVDASCEPVRTNEWRTISIGVTAVNKVDLDHIEALVFDKLAGVSGTIYIDNLRLGSGWPEYNCLRKIRFSGYSWSVLQSEWLMGAGPNYFTDDPNDVWVDANGFLHLNIINRSSNWYCSEVVANTNLGYGTYAFTVEGPGYLDPHHILGLFVYDLPDANGKHREFDVELAKWGKTDSEKLAQFVCQPWYHWGNRSRFEVDMNDTMTYEFTWSPVSFHCRSYRGEFPLNDVNNLVEEWCYTGTDVFQPGCENVRINFYLMNSQPPLNAEDAEVLIRDFHYLQPGELLLSRVLSSPNGGERFLWGAREEIRWCTGCCTDSNVVIEYWVDDSNSWREIAEAENTGQYNWVVPDCNDPNTHQGLIRIRDSEEPGVWDSSDETFNVSLCGTSIVGDENGDCYVNFVDFAILTEKWLACESPFDSRCN